MTPPVLYSMDTSAILDGRKDLYPPDVFITFWQHIEALIVAGRIIAIDDVRVELKDPDSSAWAKKNGTLFQPTDLAVQTAATAILAAHPKLVDVRRSRSMADPFVIALAQVRGARVVTGEQPTHGLVKPKIPDVCKALGVPCMNLLGLFRAEGWTA